MADNDQGQEKTEQASGKRREEAREKGQVAKSREIPSVAVLIACLIYFYFNTNGLMKKIMAIMASLFSSAGRTALTVDSVQPLFVSLLFQVSALLLPLLVVIVAVAVLANVVQVGFLFSSTAIQPELSKIDPFKGMGRLFSLRSVVELVKSILKMGIVGVVAYIVIKNEVANFMPLADQGVWGIMSYMGRISFKILLTTCWVLILLAILDYLYQRWEHEKSLRMTRQEIKDEYKNTDGNPIIKARIRRLQRDMARKRMMAAVPKADVVITNPTHLAIALKYDQEKTIAPYVVAKGAGVIAEKIREIARSSHVPVVENKPLAQVLYKIVKVDGLIPENLYRSVAEVLAYVYSLRQK